MNQYLIADIREYIDIHQHRHNYGKARGEYHIHINVYFSIGKLESHRVRFNDEFDYDELSSSYDNITALVSFSGTYINLRHLGESYYTGIHNFTKYGQPYSGYKTPKNYAYSLGDDFS